MDHRRNGCRRGEDAVSPWRKELPGQISQTPVRLQSNLSEGISQKEKIDGRGKTQVLPFCTHLHIVIGVTKGKSNCLVFLENHMVCILQQPCALGEVPSPRVWVSGVGTDPGAATG